MKKINCKGGKKVNMSVSFEKTILSALRKDAKIQGISISSCLCDRLKELYYSQRKVCLRTLKDLTPQQVTALEGFLRVLERQASTQV